MSKGNQASAQSQPTQGPQSLERQAESRIDAALTQLTELQELLLDLAVSQLKAAKAFCQCRACKKIAVRYVTAQHMHFGAQVVPLCDDHELAEGWRDTGTKREQTDENLLEIIRIVNRLQQSRR